MGITLSRTQYIVHTDGDDRLSPEASAVLAGAGTSFASVTTTSASPSSTQNPPQAQVQAQAQTQTPAQKTTQEEQQGFGAFVLALVMSVFLGILVFVGGSAWAVAVNQVLKDVNLPNHAALFIYAAIVTVVLILVGIGIGYVVRLLKIDVPLDVTTVIVGPSGSTSTVARAANATGGRRPPRDHPDGPTILPAVTASVPLFRFGLRK